MPIGILGSLAICVVLYVLFSYVMTGVVHYTAFKGHDGIAPVAIAIDHMGTVLPDGSLQPAYPWLNKTIILAILGGYSSVILVMLLGQSRVFYSMSRDGLLPKVFSQVHAKYRTPYKSNLLFLLFISVFALFVPARVAGELTSIGTLFAFIIVCASIWIMRRKMPEIPRAFKVPFVPLIPLLGVGTCLFMMIFLPFDTWIRLILWMLVGHDLYVYYGSKHSNLYIGNSKEKGNNTVLFYIGIGIALVLSTFVLVQQTVNDWKESVGFSMVLLCIAIVHILLYGIRILRKVKK
jgi:APA family basic amino acid/polyamine antiporter